MSFLEENILIKDNQHGFRNKQSCLTNLLDFYKDVFNFYDETKTVDIICLYFQNAFNKVPYERSLKFDARGIVEKIFKWLKDWLSEREQRDVNNGKSSNWRDVKSGVPQGSVLGLILFLIYVNDIDEGITCKISKYADYMKITGKVITTAEKIQLQFNLDS